MMDSWAFCKFCICIFLITAPASASLLKIQVPPVQRGGARILDSHIGSLSIESCYITDYFGNPNQKNELSWNLLTNFVGEFGGLNPYLRLGGHTQDHASFEPNQKEALKNTFAAGNDEAINVTYGSSLFTEVLLHNVPPASAFVLGLNFKTLNISIALDTARAAWEAFSSQGQQSRLHMTVGNEPDQWGWGAEPYKPHMADFLHTIQSELDLPKNWFQVGDLANPPDPKVTGQNYTNTFLLRRLLQLGLGDTHDIWTMSQHTYPFSVCSAQTAVMATLPSLLNYTHLVYHMSMFIPDIAAVNAAGYDYVLGETGSVSCHGKHGVSDTFGSTLYMINFMLHGASIGIKRSFFHNGTPFFYSLWRPIASNSGDSPTVNPTYGSFLFLSQVLGANGSEKSVVEIVDLRRNDLSAFAIFDTDTDNSSSPRSLVFVDTQVWSPPSRRPARIIDINAVTGNLLAHGFSVKRLTSLRGVNATSTDFSLAGVSVNNDTGKLVGSLETEKGDSNGMVLLNAAEAVLIEIHGTH